MAWPIAGYPYYLNVVRADDLPWPLLLGRDAPAFATLLQHWQPCW